MDVGNEALGLGGSRLSGRLGLRGLHSLLLGEPFRLPLKLLLVGLLLLGLGLSCLDIGAPLGDLLGVELVLPLRGIGVLARGEEAGEEEDREEEACDRVPDKTIGVDDAQREDRPPVQGLEEPKGEETEDDKGNVAPRVLVDTLVVRLIDGVVPGAVASELRGFPLLGVRVNCMHHL